MASVTLGVSTPSTANASTYASGSFTPAANDLLVAFVHASGTNAGYVTMTDTQSLGWTLIDTVASRADADLSYIFVANTLAANSSITATFNCTGDAATGACVDVYRVSGMTFTGSAAVRQVARQENHAIGAPAPAFGVAALTGNPVLGMIANATSPATLTAPSGWTEGADSGYATPTTGMETVWRNSGFTGTTVTWGSSSATAFSSQIIELTAQAGNPTVVLDSPVDTGTVASTTPTLTFTGTDADSDPVSYQIQIDSVNTFDSATVNPAFVQSITAVETNGTGTYTSSAFGSSTTSGNLIVVTVSDDSGAASGATFRVTDNMGNIYRLCGPTKLSDTSGNTTISMWYAYNIVGGASHTITVRYGVGNSDHNAFVAQEFSGFGVDDPLDQYIAASSTSTAASSGATGTLSQANELVVSGMVCDTNQTPTLGTGYTNLAHVGTATTQAMTAAQESKTVNSTSGVTGAFTIASDGWACAVVTFKTNLVAAIDKRSSIDSGFADVTNGADTDPFASGDTIGYTVQAGQALTNGNTYFWRLRAEDPSGTNTFGSLSSTQSFTVSAGASPQTITTAFISRSVAIHVPTIGKKYTIGPSIVSRSASTHSPTVQSKYRLTPSFLSRSAAIFGPTIDQGPVTVSPALISRAAILFTPVVSGLVTLTPSLVSRAPAVHAPSLQPEYTILAALVDRTATAHVPTLHTIYMLAPSFVSRSSAVHSPTMGEGAVTIDPSLLASTPTLYAPDASSGGVIILPAFLSHVATTHAPTIGKGAVNITPSFLSRSPSLHEPAISQRSTILPSFLTHSPSVHTPMVIPGAVTVDAGFISRSPIVYDPNTASIYTITPVKVSSMATAYVVAITTLRTIEPLSVDRSAELYSPLVTGVYMVVPDLVSSEPDVYTPRLFIIKTVHRSTPIVIGQDSDSSIVVGVERDAITIGQTAGSQTITLG